MAKDNEPDMFGAREARDSAMQSVERHAGDDWNTLVHRAVINLPRGWRGTAEDMRILFARAGLPMPHHHNAWGAVTLWARKHGLLVKVGQKNMTTVKSHARSTPVYERR